jgi:hypothetical protein
MSGLQLFLLGMMVAWTPSFIFLAIALHRTKLEGPEIRPARLQV